MQDSTKIGAVRKIRKTETQSVSEQTDEIENRIAKCIFEIEKCICKFFGCYSNMLDCVLASNCI